MLKVATMMIQFRALSYFVDMAPRLFHKIEVLSFQKMYGGTCHPKWCQQPPWLMDYCVPNRILHVHELKLGHFFLWQSKVPAKGKLCYACNVFSHWLLKPCSAIDSKRALVSPWFLMVFSYCNDQWWRDWKRCIVMWANRSHDIELVSC